METPSAGGLYLHPSRAGSRTKTQDLLHSNGGALSLLKLACVPDV